MIVLDMGSGNGNGNDRDYIEDSIDSLVTVDTKEQEVILKYQLFDNQPPNIQMTSEAFNFAYFYGLKNGYKVTASVFDLAALYYLCSYDVPFIKIANRPDLYYLVKAAYDAFGRMKEETPVLVSYTSRKPLKGIPLCCVSKYPATVEDYEKTFTPEELKSGISDHTVGLELYNSWKPCIWEKHFVLEHDPHNPDAGPFAVTAEELREIL